MAKKKGLYFYRRRLIGRRGEVAVSLRTRRYREAEHLAGLLDGAFPDVWARAVSEAETGGDLNASLRRLMNGMIAADVTRRVHDTGKPLFTGDDLDFFRRTREHARRCINAGAPSPITAKAVDWLARRHDLADPGERRFAEVAVWEAYIRATEAMEAMILGERPIAFTEPEPPPAPPPAPLVVEMVAPPAPAPMVAAVPPPKPLLSALAELPNGSKEKRAPFFKWRAVTKDVRESTMVKEGRVLRRFKEVRGDRPVDSYTRADVTDYLNKVRRLPANYGKAPRDHNRTFAEIIAEADVKGVERVKDKTPKNHLSALSQFFKFARDQSHLSQAAVNELVQGHSFCITEADHEQRDGWASEELVRLLDSPVWTGCKGRADNLRSKPGTLIIRDWRFWLVLLALFHGARLEEFADLRRCDLECEGGIWFFRLQEGEERRRGKRDADGRRAQGRRLKNGTAKRVVPLHPELVRLSFLQHVAGAAPQPDDPLFPELEPQGPDGKRGARVTRWFRHYREQVGVYRPGVAMHAFRHTANTRLRDAMVTEQDKRRINRILGHTAAGEGEGANRYDKGPELAAAAEMLARLRFPELDLSRLHVQG